MTRFNNSPSLCCRCRLPFIGGPAKPLTSPVLAAARCATSPYVGRPQWRIRPSASSPGRKAVAASLLARMVNASRTLASAARLPLQALLAFSGDFCGSRAADDIGDPHHRRVVPASRDEPAPTPGRAPDRSRRLTRRQEEMRRPRHCRTLRLSPRSDSPATGNRAQCEQAPCQS
jgi:hypothetical protein